MTLKKAMDTVDLEIAEEKASALGRIGGILDEHIATCQRLAAQAAALVGSERDVVVAKHNQAREQAELYFWFLTVQRECMGLRNDRRLEEAYPVPRRLR
jgi:hypothetical protein